MRILTLADLHFVDYQKWQDFLRINKNSFDIIATLGDIDTLFLKSLRENFPYNRIIGVHGNHDGPKYLEYWDMENVHGRTLKIGNTIVCGMEGCLRYKKSDCLMYSQEEASKIMNSIEYTDIILSHNSPRGIHDGNDVAHMGFNALIEYMDKHNPKLCLHGHQHLNAISQYNNTIVIGIYGISFVDTEMETIYEVLNPRYGN